MGTLGDGVWSGVVGRRMMGFWCLGWHPGELSMGEWGCWARASREGSQGGPWWAFLPPHPWAPMHPFLQDIPQVMIPSSLLATLCHLNWLTSGQRYPARPADFALLPSYQEWVSKWRHSHWMKPWLNWTKVCEPHVTPGKSLAHCWTLRAAVIVVSPSCWERFKCNYKCSLFLTFYF